jgi:hypothetical protein
MTTTSATTARPPLANEPRARDPGPFFTMFLFFSKKLGWLGSIAVSVVLSLLLLALFWIF